MSQDEKTIVAPEILRPLVGTWEGRGVADFPTIERAEYLETLSIELDAERSILTYEQLAVLTDGSPSHRELGFIQLLEGHRVELWNVQNNGRSEVLHGSVDTSGEPGTLTLLLHSVAFASDPRMLESHRRIQLREDRLDYELRMMTTTTEEPSVLSHLSCALGRRAISAS